MLAEKPSALFNNPKFRAVTIQFFSVLIVAGLGYYLYVNLVNNLDKMGQQFGFDFLWATAGFDIGWSLLHYEPDMPYYRVFFVGIVNTLFLSALIILFSTILGFIVAFMRLSNNFLLSQIARWYVEIVRNIPVLVQIVFWFLVVFSTMPSPSNSHTVGDAIVLNNRGFYFMKPIFESGFMWTLLSLVCGVAVIYFFRRKSIRIKKETGIQSKSLLYIICATMFAVVIIFVVSGAPLSWDVPVKQGFNYEGGFFLPISFAAAFTAMTIYRSAAIAETARAGIQSVALGQHDAAFAIGFPKIKALRLIILPQATRAMLPPLISLWITTLKESSLAVVVGFPEVVSLFMQTSLNQSGRAVEIVIMVMGFYMVTNLVISYLLNIVNKKIQIVER